MHQLSAKQLSEWEMYLSIDPPDGQKQDFRMAYMASLITNLVIRSLGKPGAKLTSAKDFFIEWDYEKAEQSKKQTPQQMKEILLALAAEHNAKIDRKKEVK